MGRPLSFKSSTNWSSQVFRSWFSPNGVEPTIYVQVLFDSDRYRNLHGPTKELRMPDIKRLHAWLGKVIEWNEQEEE